MRHHPRFECVIEPKSSDVGVCADAFYAGEVPHLCVHFDAARHGAAGAAAAAAATAAAAGRKLSPHPARAGRSPAGKAGAGGAVPEEAAARRHGRVVVCRLATL